MTKKWDRVLIFGLLLAVILSMAAGFDNECETVRENVLRLHILANSDSEEDQALKLRVRDAILRETAEDFAKSESQIETMARAEELLPKMKAVAEEALARAGSADAVRVALVNMYFETREYDGTICRRGTMTRCALSWERQRAITGGVCCSRSCALAQLRKARSWSR